MLTTENHKWFKLVDIKISFEHVDSWAKSLLFRTHHLWNSTTELTLQSTLTRLSKFIEKMWTSFLGMILISFRKSKEIIIQTLKIKICTSFCKYNSKLEWDRKMLWAAKKWSLIVLYIFFTFELVCYESDPETFLHFL